MFKAGTILAERYEVRNILGSGGFGVVYLAYDLRRDCLCALKMPRVKLAEDPVKRRRFKQEAQIWVELGHHPYLVQAYDVGDFQGQPYISMEYVAPNHDGASELSDYVKRGAIPLELCLNWIVQFCDGMSHALSEGVRSHRDIKPANLMVGPGRELKITDFGLASRRSEPYTHGGDGFNYVPTALSGFFGHTGRGIGFGTPTHMPPEQFDDAASCDIRSDIYSFGIVLYQVASRGQMPFYVPYPKNGGAATWMTYWKSMQSLHNTHAVPYLGHPLDAIIQKCTQKNPRDRFASIDELRSSATKLMVSNNFSPPPVRGREHLSTLELHNKGLSFQHLGELDKALSCFDRIIEMTPHSVTAWSNRGTCLAKLGRQEDAIAAFEKAIRIDPKNPRSWSNHAKCLIKSNRLDEATESLNQSLRIESKQPFAWNAYGTLLLKRNDTQNAIKHFNYALSLSPNSARTKYNLGRALLKEHDFEAAIYYLDASLETNSQLISSWILRGVAKGALGLESESIHSFNRALKIDPSHRAALANLACAYAIGKHYDKARTLLEAHSDLASTPLYQHNLGIIYYHLGDLSQSYSLLDKAISAEGSHLRDSTCALLAVMTLHSSVSPAHLQQATALRSQATDPELESNVMCASFRASSDLTRLSAFIASPSPSQSQRCLSNILTHNLAISQALSGDHKTAIRNYSSLVGQNQNDAMAWKTLSILYQNASDARNAVECFKRFNSLPQSGHRSTFIDCYNNTSDTARNFSDHTARYNSRLLSGNFRQADLSALAVMFLPSTRWFL